MLNLNPSKTEMRRRTAGLGVKGSPFLEGAVLPLKEQACSLGWGLLEAGLLPEKQVAALTG